MTEFAKIVLAEKLGGPEVLRVVERQLLPPGPGKVAVRVKAVGVNPVDLKILSGTRGRASDLPWQPGFEAAGVVSELGPDVTAWRPGDEVIVFPAAGDVRVGARRTGGGAHGEARLRVVGAGRRAAAGRRDGGARAGGHARRDR
jgi:NADPH:quinone reductase-like Zn-dependent oxidoreductase